MQPYHMLFTISRWAVVIIWLQGSLCMLWGISAAEAHKPPPLQTLSISSHLHAGCLCTVSYRHAHPGGAKLSQQEQTGNKLTMRCVEA